MTIQTNYGKRYNMDELIDEVERRRETAVDIITDTRNMQFEEEDGTLLLNTTIPNDIVTTGVNGYALGQFATHTKVGARYARILDKENPELLAHNLNTRLHFAPKRRMLRNVDEVTGAFLSDTYKRRDNIILLKGVQAGAKTNKDWQIHEASFTEKKLHVRMVLPTLTAEIKLNDEVALALRMTNSEVGAGAFSIALEMMRLVCLNGMVVPMKGMRKVHLGAKSGDNVIQLSDKAMQAGDYSLLLEVMDTVEHLANEDNFREVVRQMAQSTQVELDDPPAAAVVMSKTVGLSDVEDALFMKEMFKEADPTIWGLTNALTATSRDLEDYDRKVELEEFAGKVAMAGPGGWNKYQQTRAARA